MKHLTWTASGAALASLLAVTPAFAQSSGSDGGSASADAMQSAGKNPADVTCREITAMDSATVPGVLYFISGYQAGQMQGAGGGTAGMTAGSGAGDAQMQQTATGEGASGGASGGAAMEGAEATAGAGGQVQLSRIAGYFEIPVEQVMIACGQAPDRRASDMVQQNGMQGSQTN